MFEFWLGSMLWAQYDVLRKWGRQCSRSGPKSGLLVYCTVGVKTGMLAVSKSKTIRKSMINVKQNLVLLQPQ